MSDSLGPGPGFSTGPGAGAERDSPQSAPSYPQNGGVATSAMEHEVSRETGSSDVDVDVAVSRETDTVTAPTAPAAPAAPMTAAQLAERAAAEDDDLTPLARAAQATVMVRAGIPQEQLSRPSETRVFVVANQKGGVGKTTSTVNLAAALTQLGQRVLVIDLDPQGNASTALNIEHRQGTPSSYELLVDGVQIADIVQPCPDAAGLWVVPATIDLAGAEIELVSVVAREQRLKKALDAHPRIGTAEVIGEERFDYVFIDCPPSLGLLTLNALVAGAEMLIPIQAEYYALEGLGQLLSTVDMVRAHLNPDLAVSTIVLTMFDARTRLAAGVAAEVREHFGDQVLKTAIPRSVRVSEAPSYGQTVMTYDPGSPGALSYLEAAREIVVRGSLS
ncbi:hypothetical protein GCM10022237_32650 [Nocardioides ginsengisoli]